MRLSRPFAVLAAFFFSVLSLSAQTPRVLLRFDGNLTDTSGAGIVTGVTASPAWTPAYTTDRNGTLNGAIDMTAGSRSLQLVAASLSGNSNQALGLRNASGTNTSFTLSAWIYCSNVNGGYNTVFGNAGTGAGTLHAGLGSNVDKVHFGFDGNDVTGATAAITGNVWYHVAFIYDADAQTQRIFVNGVPEVTRSTVTNTLKAADLLIGNWSTATDGSNDYRGRLDDVAVWNVALAPDQIHALYNGVSPLSLPSAGTYSPPKLSGNLGENGTWGIREIRTSATTPNTTNAINGIGIGTLVNADRILKYVDANPAAVPVTNYQASTINIVDDTGGGTAGYFTTGQSAWGSNTATTDDNYILMVAKCAVRITAEDDYTFGFRGDDGSRLRILGQQFISSTRLNTGNPADPAHAGDALYFPAGSGDSNTIGVVHLKPGDYNVEFTYWEGNGGSSIEVFAAKGARVSVDTTNFKLIGDSANGGLAIVPDPDTITLTVNGGTSAFVHGGSPANLTLAWDSTVAPTSMAINPTVGTVAQTGSQSIAAPAATTTYTLTATFGTTTVTRQVTVYVNTAPQMTFAANKTNTTPGSDVALTWNVNGATSLTLNPGGINVLGQTGRTVNPASSTTYTLVATNPTGTTQQSVTVNVGAGPVISSFTASDANPLFGAETTLSWATSNAASVAINQNVGTVTASGSLGVTVYQTTTYTLTATNTYGTVTSAVLINMPTPIGVNASGFTVTRYNASTPFPFSGMGYLQSADALIAGTNLSAQTTVTGVTSINYSDGAAGEFGGDVGFPSLGGNNGNNSNFALRVTGTLVVNTPGEYTFVVNCDDGARLRVDGQDVIVDDTTHASASSAGRVTLTKPSVSFELVYFNAPSNGGTAGAAMELAWIRPNLQWTLLTTATAAAPVVRGQVLISEFLADNAGGLLDEDGESSDWLELWNSTNATVNLSGYFLTDDPLVPNKWALPAWTLGANRYLLVHASAKDRKPPQAVAGQDNPGTLAQPRMHASFKLSKTGGALALTKSNGGGGYDILTSFAYGPQRENISYGSTDSEGFLGFMETPTPGFTNAVAFTDFVADTVFSHQRGRYTTPFNLTISTPTPGAIIRYTTDGSVPTLTKGNTYTGPIAVSGTKVVRAIAFKTGWRATDVDTKSYLFIDDIVNQTTATATALGFPSAPVNSQVFRYGMSLTNVTNGGGTLQSLKNALAAAPSVCMNTDIGNLTDASTGIYVRPDKHGLFWERPCSVEYINAAGTSEFQINCGVRVRGGASRAVTNPKHAFHLYFRGSLYDGKLKYRLFGTQGANEFGQIDMRCEQNYSWSSGNSNQNSLMREEWSRLTQRDMGQPYSRTGYFHLYINGIYWGVFNWEERTESDFGETYLGGDKDNYDTVKSAGSSGGYNTEMTDGNFIAWKSLNEQAIALKNDTGTESSRTGKYLQMQGLNADGTRNPAYPVLLDVDNLIDYNLLVFYDGSFDSPLSTFLNNASNNWFGVRDRNGERGFAFFAHDHEHGMDSAGNTSYNRVGPWGDPNATGNNWNQTWTTAQYRNRETFSKSNPQYLHELLCFSAEYRQRFADRVHKHFFNGGALTNTKAVGRVNTLATEVDAIIHAEAARWGSTTLHRLAWNNTAKATVLNFMNNGGAIPGGHPALTAGDRTSIVLQQLKGYQDPIATAKPLYPQTLQAPTFSGAFGGVVSSGYSFSITNPNGGTGIVYYTKNGVDPRLIEGGISGSAQTGSSPIAVSLTQTCTVKARVYDSLTATWSALTEADYIVGVAASSLNLTISQIHYNPPGSTDPEEFAEFVEVMNVGATPIDLTNVRFLLGIQYQFPDGYVLAPGARAVVVHDLAAFSAAHPTINASLIAGAFTSGSLDNAGERLQLVDGANAVIKDFSYSDDAPWPTSPDGEGPSLVLKRPTASTDLANPANWRPSYTTGGSPGTNDAVSFASWSATNNISGASGDDDGDGLNNVGEYGLGGDPKIATISHLPTASTAPFTVNSVTNSYLTLTFTRPVGRDDVSYNVEGTSNVAATWTPAVETSSPVYNGDGTETVTYRYPTPISATPQFLRLKMVQLP